MKFNYGESWEYEKLRLENWHEWFAWRPVRVGNRDCRWLEKVQRKGKYIYYGIDSCWLWEYKEIEK